MWKHTQYGRNVGIFSIKTGLSAFLMVTYWDGPAVANFLSRQNILLWQMKNFHNIIYALEFSKKIMFMYICIQYGFCQVLCPVHLILLGLIWDFLRIHTPKWIKSMTRMGSYKIHMILTSWMIDSIQIGNIFSELSRSWMAGWIYFKVPKSGLVAPLGLSLFVYQIGSRR